MSLLSAAELFTLEPDQMTKPIERITMFKISDAGDRKKVLDQYRALKKTAMKVIPQHLPVD